MERLADDVPRYVAAQVDAGADVIQVFDSWVGALSPADYAEFVAPYSARILAAVDVPTIHFGTAPRRCWRMAAAGGDVVGLDWRIPLDRGWAEVGHDRGVQGNLDPAVLLGPWERVEAAAVAVLARRRPAGAHLQPRPRRAPRHRPGATSAGWSSSCTSAPWSPARERRVAAVVLMRVRSPERLEDVPRTTPTSAAAGPIAPERLEDLVERYRRLGIERGTRSTRSPRRRAPRSSTSSACPSTPE